MNSYVYICKKPTQNQLELAYSIGLGYPLSGCSSAEPISVFPNTTNVVKILTDTVHFTLPLCLYVLGTSLYGLIAHIPPENSIPGIAISLFAVIGMPFLAWQKKRIANEINSPALAGDATCSIACAYMAGTVLVGLVLNYLFHWWWAEHIAGLLFLYWLFKETKEAFDTVRKKQHSCGCC